MKCCRGVTSLLWNDIELSWKLHLPEHLFWIFTYKYGIVVIFLIKSFCLSLFSPACNLFCCDKCSRRAISVSKEIHEEARWSIGHLVLLVPVDDVRCRRHNKLFFCSFPITCCNERIETIDTNTTARSYEVYNVMLDDNDSRYLLESIKWCTNYIHIVENQTRI